ncbi:MAG: T9SS type A sorting domain-containing protein [Bacteroidetes bacterium]|nr:T9SS type A sorting domain-containing protein [Bacteroidota bacterium]
MKKLILLFVLLNCFVKAQVPPACFTLASTPSVGLNPRAICTADFNNDGNADLAVTHYNSNNVSIVLGAGTGSFASAVNFSVGINPTSICSGDFDNDGKVDLAVVGGTNDLSILIGSGTGSFTTIGNYTIGLYPTAILTSNFNGDGNLDLAISQLGNTAILLGLGAGVFSSPVSYGNTGNQTSIVANDFNNDGKTDLAFGSTFPAGFATLNGSGTGTFTGAYSYYFGSAGNTLISSGDINGDGKIDLVTTNQGTFSIITYTNNGLGTFAQDGNFYTSYNPLATITGDFNGDAKLDLAVTMGNNSVSIFLGLGTGLFVAPVNFATGLYPIALTSADLNSDGKIDLAIVNGNSNNIAILINTSGGTAPIVTAISNNSLICSGQSATLSANGATNYLWNTGTTSNSIVVSPTLTTTYSVVGTSTMGCKIPATITQSVSSCLGVFNSNEIEDIQLKIYPNPANDILNVELKKQNSNEDYKIEIVNILGQLLIEEKMILNTTVATINTKGLVNGVYFLNLKSSNSTKVTKMFLIINKAM